MPFSIRSTLDRIVAIERTLTIISPETAAIRAAYKYPPPPRKPIETPCFMNSPTLTGYDRGMLRQRIYQVRMQIFVTHTDQDVAGDIAVAFSEKLGIALDNDITLAGTCTLWRDLRGGVALLTWNGIDYIGMDLLMDVVLGGEVPGT